MSSIAGNKPAGLGRNWLSQLKLDWASLFSLNVLDSLHKFPELFKKGMKKLQGVKAKITLSANARPVFHKARPVPFKVTLNEYLETIEYPTPNAQDLFATLAGGRRFTRLDLKQAHQQMEVDTGSQHYLTINTRKGLFTYTRIAYGIRTAPSIVQKTMDMILSGIPGVCWVFYDILIVGSTNAQHDARVRQVLQRLKQRGVRLKKDKCEVGTSEVTYLGNRVDHEGLRPTEDKVKAIREAPEPGNVTELKAFLGLLNYSSHFLSNLANTLQALYELLQKENSGDGQGNTGPLSMQ